MILAAPATISLSCSPGIQPTDGPDTFAPFAGRPMATRVGELTSPL